MADKWSVCSDNLHSEHGGLAVTWAVSGILRPETVIKNVNQAS